MVKKAAHPRRAPGKSKADKKSSDMETARQRQSASDTYPSETETNPDRRDPREGYGASRYSEQKTPTGLPNRGAKKRPK